jgi:hypothetical protein
MRFPKTLTYCCILAVGTATATFAQDNSDAQQKALDALRQYTAEKEGKTSKPLTTQPVKKADDAAIAKELEQKAREAAQPKPAEPPAAAPAAAAVVAAPVVTKTTPPPAASSDSIETERERKAREALDALRRGGAEGQSQQALTTTAPAANTEASREAAALAALEASYRKEQAAKAAAPVAAATATATTTAPATAAMSKPMPKTRKEKLNDLLELYMDNAITPRQYHDQRAALIAGN